MTNKRMVTRGVPRFNIQIGPIGSAVDSFSPELILSFSDSFSEELFDHPAFHWIPVNEGARTWGYNPFFVTKKILDLYCVEFAVRSAYIGCRNGNHRSPLMTFCWLLSQPGATPETVVGEFYSDRGHFADLPSVYQGHVMTQQIPPDLQQFYQIINNNPGLSYESVLNLMVKHERILY